MVGRFVTGKILQNQKNTFRFAAVLPRWARGSVGPGPRDPFFHTKYSSAEENKTRFRRKGVNVLNFRI